MGCSITFPPIPLTCDGCDQAPRIGENGNWFVGDADTGVKAQGPAGQDAVQTELEELRGEVELLKEELKHKLPTAVLIDKDFYNNPVGFMKSKWKELPDGVGSLHLTLSTQYYVFYGKTSDINGAAILFNYDFIQYLRLHDGNWTQKEL